MTNRSKKPVRFKGGTILDQVILISQPNFIIIRPPWKSEDNKKKLFNVQTSLSDRETWECNSEKEYEI